MYDMISFPLYATCHSIIVSIPGNELIGPYQDPGSAESARPRDVAKCARLTFHRSSSHFCAKWAGNEAIPQVLLNPLLVREDH